jgi:hypothetical protein
VVAGEGAGRQPLVGAGHDHDPVVPVALDRDGRDPRRQPIVDPHRPDVDAVGGQRLPQPLPLRIGAHPPDQGHVGLAGAQADGGAGLVGPLAAGVALEADAGHGLAAGGGARRAHHQVGVQAADHHQARPVIPGHGRISDGGRPPRARDRG